jgi:hypothetical protein
MVRPLINLDFHLQEKFRKLCFCEDSCAVMRSSRNDLLAWSQFNFFYPYQNVRGITVTSLYLKLL